MNSYDYLKLLSEKKRVANVAEAEEQVSSFLAFSVGDEVIHIKTDDIKEIIPRPEIMPVGHARRWLEGLLKVQGEIYSAVNLWGFLYPDLPSNKVGFALALVHDSGNYAVLVNKVIGIVKVAVNKGSMGKKGYLESYRVDGENNLKVISVDDLVKSTEFIDVSIF